MRRFTRKIEDVQIQHKFYSLTIEVGREKNDLMPTVPVWCQSGRVGAGLTQLSVGHVSILHFGCCFGPFNSWFDPVKSQFGAI